MLVHSLIPIATLVDEMLNIELKWKLGLVELATSICGCDSNVISQF